MNALPALLIVTRDPSRARRLAVRISHGLRVTPHQVITLEQLRPEELFGRTTPMIIVAICPVGRIAPWVLEGCTHLTQPTASTQGDVVLRTHAVRRMRWPRSADEQGGDARYRALLEVIAIPPAVLQYAHYAMRPYGTSLPTLNFEASWRRCGRNCRRLLANLPRSQAFALYAPRGPGRVVAKILARHDVKWFFDARHYAWIATQNIKR